ncbi:hypothetical protein HOK51_03580 [Candidatus Woesearchaeota archaeon]|jgi:hypothetical protein|nr:hypothetical protein [Candidatus Woesearchaeota archaeon]MBT6518902.1 hypothetical protein [Candidatus Woesearchaeota archaeon]MBT7367570.1 hypothetical protein [Candidatus Woesearchaeota archaeon]
MKINLRHFIFILLAIIVILTVFQAYELNNMRSQLDKVNELYELKPVVEPELEIENPVLPTADFAHQLFINVQEGW